MKHFPKRPFNMRDKLPVINADQLIKILFKIGFEPKRKKGSHLILSKNSKLVVVPVHKGRDIPKGTILSILKQAGIAKKEFLKSIKKDKE